MTATIKQNLDAIRQSVKENKLIVKQKLAKFGTADAAVVFSAAKYFATIEKLAKE